MTSTDEPQEDLEYLEDIEALRAAKEAERDKPTRPLAEVEKELVSDLDLELTLDRLRAYRKSDPHFERAIADYVDAEASLKEDPAEGQSAMDIDPLNDRRS